MTTVAMPKPFKPLLTVLRDFRDTWSGAVGFQKRRDYRRAALYYYAFPLMVAVPFVIWHVELLTVTPVLTALSVFTALLFGLLILVFNTAITLRKDGAALSNAHGLGEVITDLRATIVYTIMVAVVILIMLVITSVSSPIDPTSGQQLPLAWVWTPVFAYSGTHLLLSVVKILQRIRTAFNYVSR